MKRAGFTLIELLVVIAVLSALIAVVLTVSHAAREQAKATQCQFNIRQQVLEFGCYATENDVFPVAWEALFTGSVGDLAYDPPAKWWFQFIGMDPLASEMARTLLACPSKALDSSEFQSNMLWGNYGVNWSVCAGKQVVIPPALRDPIDRSLNPATIRQPSEVFLLGDSGYAVIGWHHVLTPVTSFINPTRTMATSYLPGLSINDHRELNDFQKADALRGRHGSQRVNIGYVDGSVGRKKADDLLVEQTPDGHYTNLTPLWKPRHRLSTVSTSTAYPVSGSTAP